MSSNLHSQAKQPSKVLHELHQVHTSACTVQNGSLGWLDHLGSSSTRHDSMTAGVKQHAFLQSMLLLAEQHLSSMQSRQVSNILWACAVLGCTPSEAWLQRFADHVEQQFVGGTAPQGFSNIIWALATLKWCPDHSWVRSFMTASAPQLAKFRSQELSNTIWALASLRLQPPDWWLQGMLEAAAACMATATPQALSNMVWALATLKQQPTPTWLEAVRYHAQRQAGAMSPLALANLLWGEAVFSRGERQPTTTGIQQPHHSSSRFDQRKAQPSLAYPALSPEWLQIMEKASAQQLPSFAAQGLANVIWAFAALGWQPTDDFMQQFCVCLSDKLLQFTPAALANTVWAVGRLAYLPPDDTTVEMLQQLQVGLVSCSPGALANATMGVVQLQQQSSQNICSCHIPGYRTPASPSAANLLCQTQQQPQQPQQQQPQQQAQQAYQQQMPVLVSSSFLQDLTFCSQSKMSTFLPGELCDIGHALAALHWQPEQQWLEAYLDQALQQLRKYKPQHFASLLSTLACWKLTPPAGWAASFMAAACQRLPSFSAAETANLLQAVAATHMRPAEQHLQLMLQHVLSPSVKFCSTTVVGTCTALARLSYRPNDRWLKRFWQLSQPVLVNCRGSQLAAMLAALAEIQVRPPKAWVAAVFTGCSRQAADMSPAELGWVLWAAAELRRPPTQHEQLDILLRNAAQCLTDMTLSEYAAALWGAARLQGLGQQGLSDSLSSIHMFAVGKLTLTAAAPALAPLSAAAAAAPAAGPSLCQVWLDHLFSSDAAAQLSSLSQPSLMQLVEALIILQRPAPTQWSQSLLAALDLAALTADALVTVLRVMPLLGGASQHAQYCEQLLQLSEQHLPAYSPAQLTLVTSAVRAMHAAPSSTWFSTCLRHVEQQLSAFKAHQLISILSNLPRLHHSVPRHFLEAALRESAQKLSWMHAPLVVDLLSAIAAYGCQPGRSWWDKYEARNLEIGFSAFTGVQLTRLVWCMAAVQHKPPQTWMAGFLVAAGQILPELDPHR
eukprot:jgi/Chrzof1/8827/Cz03g25290.t1